MNTFSSRTKNNPYSLGKMVDIVTLLMEIFFELLKLNSSLFEFIVPTENAGWLGFGRETVSLPSIRTTVEIVGLTIASC